MQETYTSFASVYDEFMNNIPYNMWVDYVTELLAGYGITDGLVCELGCGTGNITRRMSDKGFDMIGIDVSEDMLSIAREKAMDNAGGYTESILYLEQDMRDFELYGTVSAVISLCDSMNYILEEEDIKKVFRLANNYLDPGGIFIFDLKTEYFYKNILGKNTIADNHDECSIIWENEYFEDKKINQYEITIYQKIFREDYKQGDNIYERSEEVHFQKAYSLNTMKRLVKESGLEFLKAYDHGTMEEPSANSERICIIAREKFQENKLYREDIT